jgi:hypothetical protein
VKHPRIAGRLIQLIRIERKIDQNPKLTAEVSEFARPTTRKRSREARGACRHISDLTRVARHVSGDYRVLARGFGDDCSAHSIEALEELNHSF